MNNKFKQELYTGELGEKRAYEYLTNLDFTQFVLDVRNDEFFQKLDVDFVHCDKEGNFRNIEVKTDTMAHRTGNLVYEHTSNKYYNTIGCFEKTRADIMFYYLTETDEMYTLTMYELRKYVRENSKYLREVNMGDNALGFLIKIDDLKNKGIMHLIESTY